MDKHDAIRADKELSRCGEDHAMCTHRRVKYDPIKAAGLCREFWACETCGAEFRAVEPTLGMALLEEKLAAQAAEIERLRKIEHAAWHMAEIDNARIAIRGHTDDCRAMQPYFGTASEDPGCTCGFQEATASGLGAEVQRALMEAALGGGGGERSCPTRRCSLCIAWVGPNGECACPGSPGWDGMFGQHGGGE